MRLEAETGNVQAASDIDHGLLEYQFFQSEDCSGDPWVLRVDENTTVDQSMLEDEGMYENISSAILPLESAVFFYDGQDYTEQHGRTTEPRVCRSLGGFAGRAKNLWVAVDNHGERPDFEFYKTNNCEGPVFAPKIPFKEHYTEDDLGSYSGEIRSLRVRRNIKV